MSTQVVNISKKNLIKLGYKDLEDWLKNPNHVYIGRDMQRHVKGAKGSKWQNPFKVNEHGREYCLELFRKYIINDKNLMASLNELDGKVLGCWCKPESCHGDIIKELIENNAKH